MIAILIIPAQVLFPWWSLGVVAFVIGFIGGQKAGGSFLSGFFGAGIVWWSYAAYKHWHTNGILSDKMATLFHLPANGWILVIVTGLVAALLGGFSCLSGRQLKQL